LFLYYSVLVERNPDKISVNEILLYIWFLAFAYDELSEYVDAGSIFYATDVRYSGPGTPLWDNSLTFCQIWNLFDITMICIGLVFSVLRESLILFSFDVMLTLRKGLSVSQGATSGSSDCPLTSWPCWPYSWSHGSAQSCLFPRTGARLSLA
jgi:hypothetical protein